ncbi:hypothetical protein [Desulfotignum balticum]|uniref:hypothetical protein n=1 Tax=Desulfotignum balticum TaxID=115781 RepID=UPI000462B44D|nr:hypothetical protein [Desulfotignum balticum]
MKSSRPQFFQYEYTPGQLKQFCEEQGFYVSRAEGCDLLFPFNQMGGYNGTNLVPGSFAYRVSNKFENTWVKNFGGQSISISVKKAPLMYCFLSGKFNATAESLQRYDIPISKDMEGTELADCYLKNKNVKYACSYSISPHVIPQEIKICDFSGKPYITDPIFEDFGFNCNISPDSLLDINLNILCCTNNIRPIWRKRRV